MAKTKTGLIEVTLLDNASLPISDLLSQPLASQDSPLIAQTTEVVKPRVDSQEFPSAIDKVSDEGVVPLAIDPQFYTWKEVDAPALLLGDVAPVITISINEHSGDSSVIVDVWVNELGNVVDVKIQGTVVPEYIEEVISDFYMKARFTPAVKDNMPRRFIARYMIQLRS